MSEAEKEPAKALFEMYSKYHPQILSEFEDEMPKYWGRKWKANTSIGKLRMVLLHRPGKEFLSVGKPTPWPPHDTSLGAWRMSFKPDLDELVDHIEDDVLRLIFLSCHPALTPESRAALTLRLVGGLTTAEIARGFLTSESTMGQRISRAKKTLATAGAELELPTGDERTRRLDDVMAVIYLVFNEGYAATAGDDWTRPDLATEGMRLARMLAAMTPEEPEVLGLQALLELQGSRLAARVDDDGQPVLLDDQDRSRWDQLLIHRGLGALERATALAARGVPVGRYFLQASIAAEHARAGRAEETDWQRIASLYDVLAQAAPGPVVEVNRAVAHGRALGADAGLAVLDAIDPAALGKSPLVPSVRGDLLERAGRHDQAAAAFTEAAALATNTGERTILEQRARDNREPPP